MRLRKKSQAERQEEDSVLEVHLHALGMLDGGMSANAEAAAADRMIAAESFERVEAARPGPFGAQPGTLTTG